MKYSLLTFFIFLSFVCKESFSYTSEDNPSKFEKFAKNRIPDQKVGRKFARLTLGLSFDTLIPSNEKWHIPNQNENWSEISTKPMPQWDLLIGGLHFFNHIEFTVSLFSFLKSRTYHLTNEEFVNVKLQYSQITGIKFYPWPLEVNSIRPFLSTKWLTRSAYFTKNINDNSNPGHLKKTVIPLGIGIGWRSPWQTIFDLEIENRLDDHSSVSSAVIAQPFGEKPTSYHRKKIDFSGRRFLLGIKSEISTGSKLEMPNFKQEEIIRYTNLISEKKASTWEVGIAPGGRVYSNQNSNYFTEYRPYLKDHLASSLSWHLTMGYYFHENDIVTRLAYETSSSSIEAYGIDLKAGYNLFLAEVLKLFDINFYGFVPYVGAGYGLGHFAFKERLNKNTVDKTSIKWVPSFNIGWDIRPTPSSWWLLRTNLRYIPVTKIEIRDNVEFDFSGLTFDFIEFLIYPERL